MEERFDIQLVDTVLSTEFCQRFVEDPACGGITTFVGTVRNATKGRAVTHLEFEAYKPMAIKEMKKIVETAFSRWECRKIALHHRVGHLGIGEIPVVISVSTPHRKNAFLACEYIIDTLKETVPIWKKEFYEDGEVWVSAHP